MRLITIIGAGIGGVVLARALYVNGFEVEVFEGEASASARSPGGMLDIHAETGQEALKACGLHIEFLALIHKGGQASRVLDFNGEVLLDKQDDGGIARPEIPRGELRRMLIESIPPGTIRWGRKLSSVESLRDGRHKIVFSNGATTISELLVGADGAWSKVRPLLTEAQPAYTGTTFIETYIHDADHKHPISADLVGGGSLYVLSPGKGIVAHREPKGVLHTYIVMQKDRSWAEAIDFSKSDEVVKQLDKEFGDWSSPIQSLIENSDSGFIPRPIYALPIGLTWTRVAGAAGIWSTQTLNNQAADSAQLKKYMTPMTIDFFYWFW